ncbi:MAG: ester cyclase [Fibrobacteres bacterium]|jgi:predicted ester cyclase|nr:ester cyclase [Fibrobacterota bacterium]
MPSTPGRNKEIVIRFNEEFIGQGNLRSFRELVAEDLVNHSAPPGAPNGPQSMVHFILEVLRKGFPDIRAEILDQIAEGDKVTTRKVLRGTHSGEFLGVAPTGKTVAINVIDIIRLRDGRYVEHWGIGNLADVVAGLRGG